MRALIALLLLGIVLDGNAKPKFKPKHKMADPTQLATGLIGYWNFEQNFNEEFPAHDLVPPHSNPLAAPAYAAVWPTSDIGKVGLCARFQLENSRLAHADAAAFRMTSDKTFGLWFKMDRLSSFNYLLLKTFNYEVYVNSSRKVVVWTTGGQTTHTTTIEDGVWYCLVVAHTRVTSTMLIAVNSVVVAGTGSAIGTASDFMVADDFKGYVDEFAIWDRVLNAEEQLAFYNNGNGITYEDIVPPEKPLSEQCRTTTSCCQEADNPFSYTSNDGEGLGYNSDCYPTAEISFQPPSGSVVVFPILVLISSNVSGAVIRYTTDSTDPDSNSTLYTGAVTVLGPVTEIRARAFVEGCEPGPVSAAQYAPWVPDGQFIYACDTPDFVGAWGVFVPNGSNDHHWRLGFTLPAITSITQFTIQQLDANGLFTTGQAWSTKEFTLDQNGVSFRTYPLLVRVGGVSQNNAYTNDYSASFGAFAAATHALDLYGQILTPLPSTNHFKLTVVFANGSQWTEVVAVEDSGCDIIDPPCVAPAAPTIVNTCAAIEVTFACTVGTAYQVLRSLTAVGGYSVVNSGNVATNPQTFADSTATPGVTYFYTIGNVPSGCVDFTFSLPTSGRRLPPAVVSISASPASICPTLSSTISWNSSEISGATVTITPTIGAQPSNTPGSQVVSPAVTTVYEISGSNACGAVTAQATVTVEPVGTCGASQPSIVGIDGYTDGLFDPTQICTLLAEASAPWNGRFSKYAAGGLCYFATFSASFSNNRRLRIVASSPATSISFTGGAWQLDIYGNSPAGAAVLVWQGTKTCGTTPAGTFNRVAGCSTTPASVSVSIV